MTNFSNFLLKKLTAATHKKTFENPYKIFVRGREIYHNFSPWEDIVRKKVSK
jgi:hypothetical protein